MVRRSLALVLPLAMMLGLVFAEASFSVPARADCIGPQCCGYGQVWNYRDRACEVPGGFSGR